jgi:hypothetical protein
MSDENKQVVFYDFFQPPLESGDYVASVRHRVWGGTGARQFDETFRGNVTFAVQGVRFSIPPSYVQGVFPPQGAQGEYGNVLPHVVFTARTLPWQRDLGIPPAQGEGDEPVALEYPWLGVLVFDESDPVPGTVQGTLGDLLDRPAGVVSYPGLTLEHGQVPADPLTYVDVPAPLFAEIAPRSDELRWLAGARVISRASLASRPMDEVDTPTGDAAIVVGNRLAREGARTTAMLVSLERLGEYLPDRQGPPEQTTAIRLAVLSAWSFSSVTGAASFSGLLQEVDASPPTLRVPYAPADAPVQAVQDALAMGYVPLPHHTRQGARLVSWYRGPLLPFTVGGTVNVPVPSQDELTVYDPASGMMDVSLSAAWQLGRLLALNDQDFSTTLYNWKRGQTMAEVNAFEQRTLAERHGVGPAPRAHASEFGRRLAGEALRPALAAFVRAARTGREDA